MRNIKKTVVEAFELCIKATKAGIKSTFFCFLEMALAEMIHKGALYTIMTTSLDRFSHSDALMEALLEKKHRHPALAQDRAGPMGHTTKGKIEDEVEIKDAELFKPLSSFTKPSLMASDDGSIARCGPRRRNKKKARKTFSRCKGRNLKRHSLLPHLLPFQIAILSTLRRKTTQDPNRLIVTMNPDIVSKEMEMTHCSFTR